MKFVVAISLAAGALLLSTHADAADLPAIKSNDTNKVPACVTPGRLMDYLKARNAGLDERFSAIGTEYMRHGEELGLRWDYAFFQMIVETGSLSYRRGNGRSGDVKPSQNNFAGLAATGGGEPGESFRDVPTGVKAHLQHVMLYAGEPVDDPVAERTRKVREWGVLTSWQKGLKKPITFRDLSKKWTAGDSGYASDIQNVARRFFDDHCSKDDPNPGLVAEARGDKSDRTAADADVEPKLSGADLARQALERGRAEGAKRTGLGATAAAKSRLEPKVEDEVVDDESKSNSKPSAKPAVTILNAPKTDGAPGTADKTADAPATVQSAAASTSTKPSAGVLPATAGKCRVWTASYGGQKSIVIRSVSDQTTNYTVLDVNEGAEKREADAYIAAYAKGGQMVGEFSSQSIALDKAFDLCPEG